MFYWTLSYIQKEVVASSFTLWMYRIYIKYCCSGCWSIWKVLVVWHEFQVDYGLSLIAQSSTNQLALSPGSPARPSNSGDEVRFVLLASSLAWLCYSVVCVEAKALWDMTSLHVSILVLGEAMVWQARLVLGFKWCQGYNELTMTTITKGAWS